MDENNDGSMTLDEFTHFVYVCQNSEPEDVKTLLFLAADDDYSQTISSEELFEIF